MNKTVLLATFFLLSFRITTLSAQCNGYTVPYTEGFQGITSYNELPLCWDATNIGTGTLTFTNTGSGANRGAFYYTPAGSNYFFSPGFTLKAGVIYSVSISYATGYPSAQGWTELSFHFGPNQNATGMTVFASTSNPAALIFTAMSGTFEPATDGDYYVGIKATSDGSGLSQHLSWDDFRITLPCNINEPHVIPLSASSNTLCSGSSLTLQATGADTYSWSGGQQGGTYVSSPLFSNNFMVTGTSTLTGCSKQNSIFINVYQNPKTYITANTGQICAGLPITLSAGGADSYSWSATGTGSQIVVYPPATAGYSVTGFNQYGCKSVASTVVQVLALPNVHIYEHPDSMCTGDMLSLVAVGATSFTWSTLTGTSTANPLQFPINASTTFTLYGKDNNGCVNKDISTVNARQCVSIIENTRDGEFSIFPNPVTDIAVVSHVEGAAFRLFDLSGKKCPMQSVPINKKRTEINLGQVPPGIYFLEISTGSAKSEMKVIKTP